MKSYQIDLESRPAGEYGMSRYSPAMRRVWNYYRPKMMVWPDRHNVWLVRVYFLRGRLVTEVFEEIINDYRVDRRHRHFCTFEDKYLSPKDFSMLNDAGNGYNLHAAFAEKEDAQEYVRAIELSMRGSLFRMREDKVVLWPLYRAIEARDAVQALRHYVDPLRLFVRETGIHHQRYSEITLRLYVRKPMVFGIYEIPTRYMGYPVELILWEDGELNLI